MRTLTEKQTLYLQYLFGDAKGNCSLAKQMAGYSDNYSVTELNKSLAEEIEAGTRELIASQGPKAAFSLLDVLDNPGQMGYTLKLAATKDLLDRAGFSKTEKIEVKSDNPLFVLPAKNDNNEEIVETTETP